MNVAPGMLAPLELPDPLELPLADPLDGTDESDPPSPSGAPDDPVPELPLDAPDEPLTGLLVTAPELLPELLPLPVGGASSETWASSPLAPLDAASSVGVDGNGLPGVPPTPELLLQAAKASHPTTMPARRARTAP